MTGSGGRTITTTYALHQTALEHCVDRSRLLGRHLGTGGRTELASLLKSEEERRSIDPADVPDDWAAY